MDPANIPTIAQKTWDAIVPRIFETLLVAFVFWIVVGTPEFSVGTLFGITPKQLLPSNDLQKMLNFYGVSTVLPIAILIAVIVFSQIVGRMVRFLGRITPPHLSENTTASMVQALDEWTLRKFWVCRPGLDFFNGLNTLYYLVNEAISKARLDPNANHRLKSEVHFCNVLDGKYDQFIFLKGLIAWAVACWILAPAFSLSRSNLWLIITLVLLLLALLIIAIYRYIDGSMDCRKSNVHTYIDLICLELPGGGQPEKETVERDRERIKSISEANCKQIWSIRFFPLQRKSLAKEQMLVAFKDTLPFLKSKKDTAVNKKRTNDAYKPRKSDCDVDT